MAVGKVFNPIPIAFHLVVGKPLIEASCSLFITSTTLQVVSALEWTFQMGSREEAKS